MGPTIIPVVPSLCCPSKQRRTDTESRIARSIVSPHPILHPRRILITVMILLLFQVGVEVAHPGVANDFDDESAKRYHTYYQWVCFVLFFQVSCLR